MTGRKTEAAKSEDLAQLNTRDRILAVARSIVDEKGEAAATMKAVAKGAGVSRQAVYLHFSDRSQLLSALSDYIDEKLGIGDWMEQIEALDSGIAMLRMLAVTRCQRSVGLVTLVRSVESGRFRNQAASSAWFRRHWWNIAWVERVIVRQLHTEGLLHPSWIMRDAATFLVTLFALRNWDDLTQVGGWSTDHYIETLSAVAVAALTSPNTLPKDDAAGSDKTGR
ncbi:TetR/AcrR family transcriptional regulator [Sphingopyxis panaciterrulae]|uniref:AcrR family transcriptional regulator n=1 Tax=Sphingopyxis panaciterrulae TaxID=462372 RepID=A0A7W9B8D6_9SPHN|nr:TetR/AcrR family transcriptional regulator [Sphingopyxis panaciterrulae]MBB5708128.1 AcrR family transcriptional regulator [Sphingopyxis panaciterrulae]